MKRIMRISVLLIVLIGLLANAGFAAEMKKVMITYSRSAETMASYALKGLEEAGFVEQTNLTSVQVLVSGVIDLVQLTAQVQEVAPDVIINLGEFPQVVAALQELSIPLVTGNGVERYVSAEGEPTANVTGIYSNLPDMVYNSYKFLQKVAPLKPGQKVVFLENPEVPSISKAAVIDALQRLQIPLKTVVDARIYEDWQQAILQYSDDPEVGWILLGALPARRQDGSQVDVLTDAVPFRQEYLKKPSVTYWDPAVRTGELCGFSIDLNRVAAQSGKLAARVLQGEPIQSIRAEYPQKVTIALNRKTATNLGIVFSMDVLNLANIIYDDYEGKQVIRK
jgi:ABC-type uncharacterized transport system substrate-binding protein